MHNFLALKFGFTLSFLTVLISLVIKKHSTIFCMNCGHVELDRYRADLISH